MTAGLTRIRLLSADEVPVGEARKAEAQGLELAVYNVDGTYYVTDDLCTHGPSSLAEGWLEGEEIECTFHQGKFNVRTGAVTAAPCMVPVKTYKAVVEDGVVYIEI